MSRRPNTNAPSTILWQIRVTQDEDERAKALAEYEEVSFSDFVRKLITEYRKRLNEQGLRPPLKPRRARVSPNSDGA
jgi:hypothetical protein